jgi:hypothetical protein
MPGAEIRQRNPKPCHGCGGRKEPGLGRGVMYCAACRQLREEGLLPKLCRCGASKPVGRGRRLCDACRDAERPPRLSPCRSCGGTEGKQPNRQYCDDCKALREWREKQRKHAIWETQRRKRCQRCGGPKGPGARRRLCDKCRAAKLPPFKCGGCGRRNIMDSFARRCDECKATVVVELRRKRHREYQRRRAAALVAAGVPMPARTYTPEQRRRQAEAARMQHWLRATSEGRQPRRVINGTDVGRRADLPRFPGRPLAVAIDHIRAGVEIYGTRMTDETDRFMVSFFERIGVSERAVTAWRTGERHASWDAADKVLVALDLQWWDVWNEDTVRTPAVVVRERIPHRKKGCVYWETRRLIPYGDLGPDEAELRRIAHDFAGEPLEVAA